MKIAIAQLNYTIGDVDGNASKIIDSIHKAKAQHADLVVFAEQAVSGTPAFDLLRKTTFLELCEDALVEIASCCDGIAAIVGLPILTTEGTISAAALIQDRKVLRYVGKKYITARREMGFLVPSKGYEYATIKGHKCAIIVGDDLSREHDFDQSVETIISVNARKYGKGTMTYRYEMMRNLAFVESKNLVLVNQVGGSTDIVYDGTSGALNSRGELVLMMKNFDEDFQIFDTKAAAEPVAVPSTYNDRTRLVYEAACCGLRDFFRKNGYRKASIGLSGGIDSAVVACIAVDALGAENVRALLMPSPFSSHESVEDAKELARNLGIEYNVIPISEIYTSVVNTLKPVIGGTEFDATEENIQTRIRTVLLMALQNKTDYILLNSSNKSENALGLCTLYGDTAGAFSPTGDLYKSEMYDVARYINRMQGDVIPENILTKEPSSELHPGQKDSDILPPYEVVDAILFRMIEEEANRDTMIVRHRKIHIAAVMHPAIHSQIALFHVIPHIFVRPMLDSSFPTMVDAEDAGRTVKTAVTMGHVKIVIYQVHTVKYPINGHKSIAAGISHPKHLAILSLHHFFQIVTHVRTVKHCPGTIFIFQINTSLKESYRWLTRID